MEEENKKSSPLTPNFSSLVVSIASTALVKMGLDPNSKEEKNMSIARYNIDLLSLLKEKTANNLTEKESELLNACISDLQVQFVQHSSMSDKKAASYKKEETGSTKETKGETGSTKETKGETGSTKETKGETASTKETKEGIDSIKETKREGHEKTS